MAHRFFPVLLLLPTLLVAPCLAQEASARRERGQAADAPAGTAKLVDPRTVEYQIGVEDVLGISVWRDPDLTQDVPVRPDGMISLPLLQDILAAGKTPSALAEEIRTRLQEYLSSPSVTVTVKEVNSLKVYVLGEVVTPGPIPLRSRVRLLQAISLAGGVTPFGGRNGVVVYRSDRLGESIIELSYKGIVSGKRPGDNILLEPGDTVVVR